MRRRVPLLALALALAALAGLAVSAATAGTHEKKRPHRKAAHSVLIGIQDDANTLYGDPSITFPVLEQLRPQVLRVNMIWGGGSYAVAKSRPAHPADPADPAYDWSLYDRVDRYASQYGIKLMFTIIFTPRWANGGAPRTHAPTTTAGWNALHNFAYAAAKRYSGTYTPPDEEAAADGSTAGPLPAVRFWTAWNEPNNPIWLAPQWRGNTIVSARNYVKICNAVYGGVHATGIRSEKVACGVTGPRGNDAPRSSRPSTDPMAFMRALKRYGLKRFDVYAHNPYYGSPRETPAFKPKGSATVELGNISILLAQLSRLWGPKHLWITEYAYQTTPQDKFFGVTWAKQALYLKQSYAIARANRRIDMFVWFMLKDDTNIGAGWQSGLLTATWRKKPAFFAFQKLPR